VLEARIGTIVSRGRGVTEGPVRAAKALPRVRQCPTASGLSPPPAPMVCPDSVSGRMSRSGGVFGADCARSLAVRGYSRARAHEIDRQHPARRATATQREPGRTCGNPSEGVESATQGATWPLAGGCYWSASACPDRALGLQVGSSLDCFDARGDLRFVRPLGALCGPAVDAGGCSFHTNRSAVNQQHCCVHEWPEKLYSGKANAAFLLDVPRCRAAHACSGTWRNRAAIVERL